MIVYDLFVHKKSVWKRKVCIIFIKKLKLKKTKKTQKSIFSGFFKVVFFGWVFLKPTLHQGHDGEGGLLQGRRHQGPLHHHGPRHAPGQSSSDIFLSIVYGIYLAVPCNKHWFYCGFESRSTVAQSVLRIRDVYPGSRIRIFSIPDPIYLHPGFRIRIKELKCFNPNNGF